MKQYRVRLTILILLAFLILSGVLFTSYYMISNNFVNKKAEENIVVISDSAKVHLDFNLQDDYLEFIKFYELYKEETNPVREMLQNINNITLQGVNFSGIGYIEDTGFKINDTDYNFKTLYSLSTYYNMNISIYSFTDILEANLDEKIYLVFQYENVIAYLDANLYFEGIITLNDSLASNYFIMHKDGYIFHSGNEQYSKQRFGNYITNELDRTEFFVKINDPKSNLMLLKLFDIKTFVTFKNLRFGNNIDDIFIVQAFEYENMISHFTPLIKTLIYTYLVASLIFMGFLLVGYKFNELKFSDIEDSKLRHYYSKPYIIYVNKKGRILSFNKSIKDDISGCLKLKSVRDFVSTEDIDILEHIKLQKNVNVIMQCNDSERYIRFIPVKYLFKYALIGDDITSIEKKFVNYKSIAYYNQITKLPNVYHLKHDLVDMLEEKITSNNVLAMVSISNFNNLNNLFGEKLLNNLLLEIKTLLSNLLSSYNATLYNLYYDHFAILFQENESFEVVNNNLLSIMGSIDKTIDFENNKLNLDFRMGVFNIDENNLKNLNADIIYNNATLALKKAEFLQSKKIAYYDITLGQQLSKRDIMEEDLRKAIEKDEFMIYLQPQFSTVEDKIVSFEALVRWNNPKYIKDSPQEFITLAESNNMIIEIGKIIIWKTMELAKKLENYDIKISINISPAQMLQTGFINDLLDSIDKHKVKREMIAIEVTETFLMNNFVLVVEKLKQLRKYGISIHLDDFGTGHSSLLYLKELPIDTIKIDKQFVDTLLFDKYSKAIINMIISLAKTLGLKTIAEGIETDKQYNALKKMGCDIIQGYYIGKAVPFDKTLALLKKTNLLKEETEGKTNE